MRRIVIEGPDGSGKSTLAKALSQALNIGIRTGLGPEKYPGEINQRARLWLDSHFDSQSIFDRHPCISHTIYQNYTKVSLIDKALVEEFYQLPSLIIYCRGEAELKDHQVKGYDSQQHLSVIERCHRAICSDYDLWAVGRANLIYDYHRIDDLGLVIRAVKGAMNV